MTHIQAILAQAPEEPPATPRGGLPTHDWQFWVVTLLVVIAAGWMLLRVVRAVGRSMGKHPRPAQTRTTLTIEGKPRN